MNKLSVFFLVVICVLSTVPADSTQNASISIDGSASDWLGLEPSLVDPENDSMCNSFTDIKRVYTAIDNNNAYMMLETYGTPVNPDAGIEINFDYKEGQHFIHGSLDDLHSSISGSVLTASTDNDLDGNIESYPILGYEIAWGDVIEIKIPLTELENTEYFNATFINTWDHQILADNDNEGCDPTNIPPPLPTASLTPVDFTDGWDIYIDDGTISFTPDGTTLSISASGVNAIDGFSWGNVYKQYVDSIGIIATFNVSSTSSNSDNDVLVGLRQYVGYTTGGNRVLVQLGVKEYNQSKRIDFQLRERTPEGVTVKYYAQGIFGGYSDNLWALNTDVTIGFAVMGDTVAFYTPGDADFIKIRLSDLVPPEIPEAVELITWASDNGPDQITATASNVYVLTSENLRELAAAGFINGDANLDGKIGLEDAINALRVVSGN